MPDGTGGLVSWAKAEGVEQAMPVRVAAVSRVRSMGNFMALELGALDEPSVAATVHLGLAGSPSNGSTEANRVLLSSTRSRH